jgi:hypothetical protein
VFCACASQVAGSSRAVFVAFFLHFPSHPRASQSGGIRDAALLAPSPPHLPAYPANLSSQREPATGHRFKSADLRRPSLRSTFQSATAASYCRGRSCLLPRIRTCLGMILIAISYCAATATASVAPIPPRKHSGPPCCDALHLSTHHTLLDPWGPAARSDPPVFYLRSSWCLLHPPCSLRSFWRLS